MFDEVYNGSYYYVIWNDQFYGDPIPSRSGPGGHSKGMVAWNENGEGFVMQVSTPSWPASGSNASPRKDGNTLGCVEDDNVKVSQHFFALKLIKDDLLHVFAALRNASVVTDPSNRQLVRNGGPPEVQDAVSALGKQSPNYKRTNVTLSSGVQLISKPSALPVPPWQMVSATLNSLPLRAATWWHAPWIPTTTAATRIDCWDNDLVSGPVEIATTGRWNTTVIGLQGVMANGNHAKIGVSTDPKRPYVIFFGDLNQQGALKSVCKSSQNGRGGTFYIIQNEALFEQITGLLKGDTAPAE